MTNHRVEDTTEHSPDIITKLSDILFEIIQDEYNVNLEKSKIYSTISFSSNLERADLSTKIAFLVSASLSKNPKDIAKELETKLSQRLNSDDSELKLFSGVKAVGPYLNFSCSTEYILNMLTDTEGYLGIIKRDKKDEKDDLNSRKFDFIFEYPSVNPNKPWHLGHLRNVLIGDTLSNLIEERGFSVLRLDYIDNLGLQVAQTLWWIRKNNLENRNNEKYDLWLGNIYVDAAAALNDPNNEKEARVILKKLEDSNSEISKFGRSVVEKCVHAQYETAYKFGIYHDILFFESDVVNYLLSDGLPLLKSNDNVYTSPSGSNKGCLVVKISNTVKKRFGDLKSDEKILIRSDGTLTYTGKDIIFHMWKSGILKKQINVKAFDNLKNSGNSITYMSSANGTKFNLNTSDSDKTYLVNIIGSEQSFPQAVVSDILHSISGGKINLIHIAYEHVKLADGKFSGRAGTWKGYTADQFILELIKKIKTTFYSDKPVDKNVLNIAIGAIRYSFLKVGSSKTIVFDWDSALNTKGNSGPYLQYALVRAKSIVKKLGEIEETNVENINYTPSPQERRLILNILKTRYIVQKPNLAPTNTNAYFDIVSICDHTYSLALEFNKFYTSHKVIGAETEDAKKFRAMILNSFIVSMNYLFMILGIPELDSM